MKPNQSELSFSTAKFPSRIHSDQNLFNTSQFSRQPTKTYDNISFGRDVQLFLYQVFSFQIKYKTYVRPRSYAIFQFTKKRRRKFKNTTSKVRYLVEKWQFETEVASWEKNILEKELRRNS